MKNKIRVCILFLIIIFTAGCSVEYDLTVNEDYSVSEKVIASENTNKMESITRQKGDKAVNYLYNMFKRKDSTDKVNTVKKEDVTTSTVSTYHSDIIEYSNNFKSDVFEKVNVQKNNGEVLITANQSIPLSKNTNYSLIYDDITIKIKVPFIVSEHNADKVVGNTYIWNINKNSNLKNIKLKYDEGSKVNSLNIKINEKTYNINYEIIIISGIIVLLLIIIFIVVVKNKKNNSF